MSAAGLPDPMWRVRVGDVLQACLTIHMEDGFRERVFTAGRRYVVVRERPLRAPAAVVVIDDAGREHGIDAAFLPNFLHFARGAA